MGQIPSLHGQNHCPLLAPCQSKVLSIGTFRIASDTRLRDTCCGIMVVPLYSSSFHNALWHYLRQLTTIHKKMTESDIRKKSLQILIHRETNPTSDLSAGAVWITTSGRGDTDIFVALPHSHYTPILQQSTKSSQEICLTGGLPVPCSVHPSSKTVSFNLDLLHSYVLRRTVNKYPIPEPINANESGEMIRVETCSSEGDLSLIPPFSTIGTKLVPTSFGKPQVVCSGLIMDDLILVERLDSDLVFELANGNSFDLNSNYLSAPVFSAKGEPIALVWGCSKDRMKLFAVPLCNRSNLAQLKGVNITTSF